MAAVEFPCPECGAKKRFHKKGCSVLAVKLPSIPIQLCERCQHEVAIYYEHGLFICADCANQPNITKSADEISGLHFCCNRHMRRTDGGPDDVMCKHYRLLTDDCPDCRREHHGVLTYQCSICGSQVQDAPHLATGSEARAVTDFIR